MFGRTFSSWFGLASLSAATFSLVRLFLGFSMSALVSSVAVPASLTLFALGSDFFVQGSSIWSESPKSFAKCVKISWAVFNGRIRHLNEGGIVT